MSLEMKHLSEAGGMPRLSLSFTGTSKLKKEEINVCQTKNDCVAVTITIRLCLHVHL